MHITRSSRVLVATFVVAGLTASTALASGGQIDKRSPDAKDAAATMATAKTIDRRSPDAADAARMQAARNVSEPKDLRTTSSLAGPPVVVHGPVAPPEFPTNTVPLAPPAEPVSAPPSGDGFNIGDAAIGAAGVAVLFAAVAGGLALSRRRRIATVA